jgi:branched-chain amino acid transport system permease protein
VSKNRNFKWIFLLCLLAVVILTPLIIDNKYYLHILIYSGITTLPALGLTLFMGTTGQISLGHAALYGIGAYTYTLCLQEAKLSFLFSLILGGIMGGVFAALLGIIALKRAKGIYLAVVTFSFNAIVRMVMLNEVSITGGPTGISGIPAPTIGPLVFKGYTEFYYLVVGIVLICLIAVRRLNESRIGNAFKAIANNELAASSLGINVFKYKVISLGISGILAGVGGGMYASFSSFISPNNFGFMQSIAFLSMAVIGGLGNIYGAIVGSIVVVALPEALGAFQQYQQIFYGTVLIVVLIFLPQGIADFIFKPFRAIFGNRFAGGQNKTSSVKLKGAVE